MIKHKFDNLSDKQLIDYLIEGNQQVIEYFFYKKCGAMFDYILKEVFEYKVGKDELINELYLHLCENRWERLRKFEGRSRLTTWLSVVSVRFFKDKKSTMIDSTTKLPLKDIETMVDKLDYEQFSTHYDLYCAIQKLPNSRDRFVIMALDIEGRAAEEVAKQIGVTVANLYNIKKRAHYRLSNILSDYKYVN